MPLKNALPRFISACVFVEQSTIPASSLLQNIVAFLLHYTYQLIQSRILQRVHKSHIMIFLVKKSQYDSMYVPLYSLSPGSFCSQSHCTHQGRYLGQPAKCVSTLGPNYGLGTRPAFPWAFFAYALINHQNQALLPQG